MRKVRIQFRSLLVVLATIGIGMHCFLAQAGQGFEKGDKVLLAIDGVIGEPQQLASPNHQGQVTSISGNEVEVSYIFHGTLKHRRVLASALRSAYRPEYQIAKLRDHKAPVASICFSHDGTKLLALGPLIGLVKIWDLKTMSAIDAFEMPQQKESPAGVEVDILTKLHNALARSFGKIWLSPDDGLVVRIHDKLIVIPDLKKREENFVWIDPIREFSVSADGKSIALLLAADSNDVGDTVKVQMYDAAGLFSDSDTVEGSQSKFKTSFESTSQVAISNRGELVIVASRPNDENPFSEIECLFDKVAKLKKPFEKSAGRAIAIGYIKDQGVERPMFVHGNQLCELAYNKQPKLPGIVEVELDVRAELAHMGDTASPDPRTGFDMIHAAFDPGSRWVVTGHENGQLMFFDTVDGKQLANFPSGAVFLSALAVSPDGKLLATADDKDIIVWSVDKIIGKD